MSELKGIDVSVHQGNIDWEKVKNSGIQFAMLRATYGTKAVDGQFKRNADECTRLGIPFGAYVYSYARNTDEARTEVELFINTIKPYKLSYPAVIDMEDADSYKSKNGVTNAACVDICEVECKILEEAGYYAMIYANLDWLKNKINDARLDRFDKWLAQWSNKPTYNKAFGIWQYTSDGDVAGISGRVDMNIAYNDYPAIIGEKQPTPAEEEKPQPVPQVNPNTYTVKAGDTLSGIASKYGTTYQELARINNIENPNLIYPNQILTLPNGNAPAVSQETTYTVKSGDTLSDIAKKYGTTWQAIYEKNKSIIGSNPNLIYAGQVLKI